MNPDVTLLIFIAVMVLMIWWMSRSSKSMQKKVELQRQEAVALGNNVVTTSGFFGTIVDIDGDAVTLQSPSGDETVWLKKSISAVADLPLAEVEDNVPAADEEDFEAPDSYSPESENTPSSDQPSQDGEINGSTRF
ncbi:preprotein translocase subunit YajC [Changpingibacter yushuensis]|uniref:preprotein translocase subunit YajC n=1 Tax=Changpingibacter yushuensis TaxID=2758440 RepID=UPI0015F6F139|nr:preprotein translocase subunit YajC [Changpingibacter yushuensis]